MPKVQCAKCPWKQGTNPRDIPGGYCEDRHRDLQGTIREGLESLRGPLRIMACHEYPVGQEEPCAGWLVNQLINNNLGLRMAVRSGQIDGDVRVVGPQHATLEETFPHG